ncbi:ABC transporter substrate-binding protein [Muricoccus pecuniae]|uniref:Iron complex transport system substrate-binding protein n=1 Tax=Muricoccus pecuniae TaxID=693023 RepID=A0A840Y2W4_9PROT|nr:ABC transporter substrate-binding protein [Roseomonas pecuniae]MBB5695075.1 iron complex transport system substrate-binding protein [Roseomonas pecuniae]
MIRRSLLRLAALLPPLLAAAPSMGQGAPQPITLRDVAGREVVLPAPAKRLLLGEGRLISVLALLEREDPTRVVAGWMGEFHRLDPQGFAQLAARFPAAERIPVVGASSAETFSIESALTARPDLVVLGLDGHGPGKGSEAEAQFARAGVPVVFVDFRQDPLNNTLPSIALLGKALGRDREAAEYVGFAREHAERIRARLAEARPTRPAVLMELRAGGTRECCGSPGRGNLGGLIELAGGDNIGAGVVPGALGTLNLEYVVTRDPAVYVATGGANGEGTQPRLGPGVTPEEARAALVRAVSRPGVSGLSGVKAGRAHALWHSFYDSPYNLLALEALARWLHPDLFADIDPAATLAEMNRRFLPSLPLEGTYWVSLR